MSEATGDGANVDARPDELGRSEVAEVVKADVRGVGRVADLREETRDVVGAEGLASVGLRREDVRVRVKLDSGVGSRGCGVGERSDSSATPTESRATRRERFVFVDLSSTPPFTTTTDRATSIRPCSRSTSDQRSPHSSPRRMPVSAANIRSFATSGSRSSAISTTRRTTSTDGTETLRWTIFGGFDISATLRRTQPQRTAWWRAAEIVAW